MIASKSAPKKRAAPRERPEPSPAVVVQAPSSRESAWLVVLEGVARELRVDQEAGTRRPETLTRLRRALSVVLDALDAYAPET